MFRLFHYSDHYQVYVCFTLKWMLIGRHQLTQKSLVGLTWLPIMFAGDMYINSSNWLVEGTAVIGDREILIGPRKSPTPLGKPFDMLAKVEYSGKQIYRVAIPTVDRSGFHQP
jgi:hypothetical protein